MTNAMYTLADLRRQQRLSQAEVARRMDVTQGQVSRIEATYPGVMFETAARYFHAIGLVVRFTDERTVDIASHQVGADPERAEATERRRNDPARGAGTAG